MSTPTIVIREVSASDYSTALEIIEKTRIPNVSFLQAPLYDRLQSADGKVTVRFVISQGAEVVGCGLAVRYTAPGGLNFLYCPYGPTVAEWSEDLLRHLRDFLRPIALSLDCSFVRLDADELSTSSFAQPIRDAIARTASLQPRAEWLLELPLDEETVWMGMHKHARYNVRLAERAHADIRILKPSETPLEDFYSLMKTTAERDTFGLFSREYYKAYLRTMSDSDGFVVMCYIDNKPAATGLFVLHDQQVHYVFAGSSNDYRKIAPAYAVIWTAVQEARNRGGKLFNFGGITDTVKSHDLGGVTSFKKRFGGYPATHQNPVDLVYKPLRYQLFKLYKTLR